MKSSLLGSHFHALVPNGVFVAEEGKVRLADLGGLRDYPKEQASIPGLMNELLRLAFPFVLGPEALLPRDEGPMAGPPRTGIQLSDAEMLEYERTGVSPIMRRQFQGLDTIRRAGPVGCGVMAVGLALGTDTSTIVRQVEAFAPIDQLLTTAPVAGAHPQPELARRGIGSTQYSVPMTGTVPEHQLTVRPQPAARPLALPLRAPAGTASNPSRPQPLSVYRP